MKPRLFIGSSVEGLNVAYAIQQNLTHDTEATVWDQGVFELSATTIESLIKVADTSDFAIFVFSPDDIIKIRDKESSAIRDNVLFEFGLFIGRLNRDRVFFIVPEGSDYHLPTDLLGITPGKYNPHRTDNSFQSATAPACNQIRQAIKKLPLLRPAQVQSDSLDTGNEPNKSESDWILLFADGEFSSARKKLNEILPSKSGDSLLEHHVWLAYIDFKENVVSGLENLLNLAHTHENSLAVQKLVSKIFIWDHHTAHALEIIDRALINHPNNPELLIAKSECLKTTGRPTDAIAALLCHPSPENPEISVALASVYESQGETDKAINCLHAAYSKYPSSQSVAFKYAKILQEAGNHKEALYILNYLTVEHPKVTSYLGQLSNSCLQLNLYNKAMVTCKKASDLAQDKEPWLIHNVGNILNNRGFYSDAIEWLQKGLELEPTSDYAHTRLASALQNANNENGKYTEICNEGRILLHNKNITPQPTKI